MLKTTCDYIVALNYVLLWKGLVNGDEPGDSDLPIGPLVQNIVPYSLNKGALKLLTYFYYPTTRVPKLLLVVIIILHQMSKTYYS